MRRAIAILLLSALSASAQTWCTVTGHLSRAISVRYTNMVLTFTPESTPLIDNPLLVSGATVTTTSTAPLGFFTIDLEHGIYRVQIGGLPRDTFRITIPAETLETNHISTYITSGATTNFVAGDVSGWTKTMSDSRYVRLTNGVAVRPVLSNNTATAGWVWTATNAQGAGHWAASAGGGIAATNPNQFAASATLSIKDGASLTNLAVWGQTNNGVVAVGSDGVAFSGSDGTVTIAGIGNGVGDSVESIKFNLNYDANEVALQTASGVTSFVFDGIGISEGDFQVPNSTDHLGFFAATTSSQLGGVISDELGSGSLVFQSALTNASGFITNLIWSLADVGTPASGDLLLVLDVSAGTFKYVTASQLTGAGGAGTVTHTSGALTVDLPVLGNGGDDIKSSSVANFLSVLSVPTHAQLVTASNTLRSAFVVNDTTTSNGLVTLLVANDTITSNGAVAFTMTASNTLRSAFIANDTTTSNGLVTLLVANDTTTSNGLVTLLVANDTTTSNSLRSAFIANDTTTSNGLITLLNTKVETNHNTALGTNFITHVADIGTPAAGDMVPIVDVSDATRKYVLFSALTGTASAGGADTQLQYNNAGSLDGAAKILIAGESNLFASGTITAKDIIATNSLTLQGDGSTVGGFRLYESDGTSFVEFQAKASLAENTTNVIHLGTNAAVGGYLGVSAFTPLGTLTVTNYPAPALLADFLTASNLLDTRILNSSNANVAFTMTASNTLHRLGGTNANTLYLRKDGDDATAVRGNASLAYSTWAGAVAAITSGDTLLIHPGDYVSTMASNTIVSTLYNKTNVAIVGVGRPKLWATNDHKGVFLNLSNAYFVTISGLDFMGSTNRDTSNNGLASAVQFSGSNIAHITIEGNRFDDWAGNVIVHPDASRGLSSNVVVRANSFFRTGQFDGIAAADHVEGSAVASLGSYSQVTDNYFEDVWRGIEYENPGTYQVINALVARNVFNGWKEKGIFDQQSGVGDRMIGWTVIDNIMFSWKTNVISTNFGNHFGIKQQCGFNTLISGNQIIGARGSGIVITPSSGKDASRIKIIGNHIYDAGSIGIQAYQASATTGLTNLTILNNTIAYVTNSGMQINATGARIEGNTIAYASLESGTGNGIWILTNTLNAASCTNIVIRNNLIEGSTIERGVRLDGGMGTKIIGNDFVGITTPVSDAGGQILYEESHTHADAYNGGTLASTILTDTDALVRTNVTSTNFIWMVEDVGTPASDDRIPLLDVSAGIRKYALVSAIVGAGANGPGMLDFNSNQFDTNAVVSIKSGALTTNVSIRTALTLPHLTADRAAAISAEGMVTNALPTIAELNYVDGVTSAIQTQLDAAQTELDGKMNGATNGNQFGATTTLTIKTGSFQTNNFFWGNVTNSGTTELIGSVRLQGSTTNLSTMRLEDIVTFASGADISSSATANRWNGTHYVGTGIVLTNRGGIVPAVLTGLGAANTNYTANAQGSKRVYINGGLTNVLLSIMNYSADIQDGIVFIFTNRTATSRILHLNSVTNNWINLQSFDSVSAPITLTNGLAMWLSTEILGTNVYWARKYMANPPN